MSVLCSVSPGSPAGFPSGGFVPKSAPSSKGGGSWQTSRPPAQGTSWSPQAKPPPKACAQPRSHYATNFSVIGGREERGVRAPSFGESRDGPLTCVACPEGQVSLSFLTSKPIPRRADQISLHFSLRLLCGEEAVSDASVVSS
jgi:hypothetical protein